MSSGITMPQSSIAAGKSVTAQPAGTLIASGTDNAAAESQAGATGQVQTRDALPQQPGGNSIDPLPAGPNTAPALPPETTDHRPYDYPSIETGFEVNPGAVRLAAFEKL